MMVEADSMLGRRDRKKLQTRAALVDAALRLAAERGLDNVTVEDISEAADVSSRTFFNYFASKDQAILDGQIGDHEGVRQRFAAMTPGVPVLGAIRLAITPVIEQMQADRELWRLRMRVVAENPSLLTWLVVGNAAAEQAMARAVAVRLGLPPDHAYPPLVVAATSAAFRTAMVRWAAAGTRRSLADLVDEGFTLLATGLADPTNPQPPRRASRAARPSMKDAA